jgi:hypothetical protein
MQSWRLFYGSVKGGVELSFMSLFERMLPSFAFTRRLATLIETHEARGRFQRVVKFYDIKATANS